MGKDSFGPGLRLAWLMSETARTGRLSGRPGRGLIWAILGLFCLVNLALLVRSYDGSIGSDYLFFYSGVVGAHLDGFRHLYDPVSQQKGLPPGYPQAVWAFAYPPLMAVLVWPFAYLPFWPSYFAWMAFQFASWLFAWRILAPETRSLRRMWLLALFAVYAVTFGLRMGQSDGYIAACVAGAWALTGRGRPYLAGFALALASVKPHLTWLIPVALVNKLVSLSDVPSSQILKAFAKNTLS